MIEQLLPASTYAVETFTDRLGIALFPEEEAAIARAIPTRRREFITARACARDALAALGIGPTPIVPGERGAPTWPPTVVGSMTHCQGYRAAVVARSVHVISIGIDAEPNAPLPDGVLEQVTVPDDLPGLEVVRRCGVAADRLLFSAKESIYKAWFPLARRWLGFEDATVTLRADGTFAARLLVDGAIDGRHTLTGLEGQWLARRGLLATAVTVPAC